MMCWYYHLWQLCSDFRAPFTLPPKIPRCLFKQNLSLFWIFRENKNQYQLIIFRKLYSPYIWLFFTIELLSSCLRVYPMHSLKNVSLIMSDFFPSNHLNRITLSDATNGQRVAPRTVVEQSGIHLNCTDSLYKISFAWWLCKYDFNWRGLPQFDLMIFLV